MVLAQRLVGTGLSCAFNKLPGIGFVVVGGLPQNQVIFGASITDAS